MKKQFVLMCSISKSILTASAVFLLIPVMVSAQTAIDTPVGDLLTRASFFIQQLIIPALFGIAFLFFLINLTRYYIIGATNEDSRVKARRNTLYGLIAFVFLISIWGIITLLLNGLGIEKSSSVCPDYVKDCGSDVTKTSKLYSGRGSGGFPGSNTAIDTTGGTRGGTNTGNRGAGGNNTGGAGSGSNTGGGTNESTGNSNFSGLSELIFGTGKDSALFSRYTGGPRAIYQTPTVSESASCTSGLETLALANRTETAQAAYVLYKDSLGTVRWKNITDLSSANHITYDRDALDALLQTNVHDVFVIHTHPDSRSDNLNLTMEGQGPSSADFKAMCNVKDVNITYAVADWGGIWTYKQNADTCPYSYAAGNILPVIETYGGLAALEASTRQPELITYTSASITPTQYKNHFSGIDTQLLPSMTPEEVLNLSTYYQTYASTTVTYQQSVDAFCSTF